jgi:hypothetical protein
MKRSSRQHSISRRTVLAGAASVIALGVVPPSLAVAPSSTSDIARLAALLEPMKRRCLRLHRRVRQLSNAAERTCGDRSIAAYLLDGKRNPAFDAVRFDLGYDAAWQRWSTATNEALDLANRIRRTEAIDVEDLAIKFEALLWLHFHHEMALSIDPVQLRQLRDFGRELARRTA